MFQEVIKKVSAALEAKQIPYMIIGGHAVILYGEARLTRDIDITLGIDQDRVCELINLVNELAYKIIPKNAKDFVNKTMVLPVIDTKYNIRVDFIFSLTPYEEQALKRVNKIDINGTIVSFASCEDLIIHKVFAQRPRDLEDVASVILKNKSTLDTKYINKWLKEFELIFPEKKFLKIFKAIYKKN